MNKGLIVLISIVATLIIAGSLWFGITPSGRSTWNNWFHAVQKADDATQYATRKQVEDTCRSMIASYNSDKLYYETYKDSEIDAMRECAMQALARANKTASTYNNYILKNSYVWKDNIPNDIEQELEFLYVN